jgi:hypothetical protein
VLACESVEQLALDVVVARYKKRGVKLPYSDKAREYQMPTVYEVSNEERITEWLVRCAASAFRKVKNEALRKVVAEAFGLGYKPLKTPSKPVLSNAARDAARSFSEMREMRAARGADLEELEV